MSDTQTPNTSDNHVIEFLKFVLTDVVSKITMVTVNMNEVTNQVKTLITLENVPPSRNDLLQKINDVIETLSDDLNTLQKDMTTQTQAHCDKLQAKIDSKEIEQSKTNTELLKLAILIPRLEEISSDVKKITGVFVLLSRLAKIMAAIIPVLWGVFHYVEVYVLPTLKK
jgi:hypothetical protein